MKKLLFILGFISVVGFSQTKYITKTGTVNFEASVPSFEEVAAENKSTTAIYSTENGGFAALVLVKGFRFKNALMEEHFNENYAESDKYPKATFKGTISEPSNGHQINGELKFHGKTKLLRDIPVVFSIENGIAKISGNLVLKASDFDIKIPKIVRNKISESVKVTFNFILKEK